MTRYAIVTNARTRREAEEYLPGNYEVVKQLDYEPQGLAFLIAGNDSHGWTLDDYVIPRYASGLIQCREVDAETAQLSTHYKKARA